MPRKVDPFKPWIGCDGQGHPPKGRKTIGSPASPLSHGKEPNATRSENSVGCRLLKTGPTALAGPFPVLAKAGIPRVRFLLPDRDRAAFGSAALIMYADLAGN